MGAGPVFSPRLGGERAKGPFPGKRKPGEEPEAACRAGRSDPRRCRLGARHGAGVRGAPEATIASKRGRGCHGCGPTGYCPIPSGTTKLGQGTHQCKNAFSMPAPRAIARGSTRGWQRPDGRQATLPSVDKRQNCGAGPRGAPVSIASRRLSGLADTTSRIPMTELPGGSALNLTFFMLRQK